MAKAQSLIASLPKRENSIAVSMNICIIQGMQFLEKIILQETPQKPGQGVFILISILLAI